VPVVLVILMFIRTKLVTKRSTIICVHHTELHSETLWKDVQDSDLMLGKNSSALLTDHADGAGNL
jgi:hypothetical protein